MSLITNKIRSEIDKELVAKVIVFSTITIMVADIIYMNIAGVHYGNKDACVLYNFLPKWAFFIYEHIIELFMVVVLGVFGGVLIEMHTQKIKRFFPRNQLLAFIYASFLPICSCGIIPVVESMKQKVKLRTLVTFIIAAPLLNPYIIFMSVSVLGVKYAVFRVVASFLLTFFAGIIVEVLVNVFRLSIPGVYDNCDTGCTISTGSPYRKTMQYLKRLFPYILLAGLLTLAFEFFHPQRFLETISFSKEPHSTFIMMLVGIPIYVCNGADVLFIKPLLEYTDLTMSAAMTFSLTSSAVCISSIVMLTKFFGKKVTAVLLFSIIISIFIIGFFIKVFWELL